MDTSSQTRREAYDSIDINAGQQAVLEVLREHGQLSADEAASLMGRRESYVRPRFSELKELRLIQPTGERRPSCTGKPQAVFEIAPPPKARQKELF